MNVEQTTSVMKPMPVYVCHKIVGALKILRITAEQNGDIYIIPAEKDYNPFRVSNEYMLKHNPLEGGYYVKYKDGYESYSPANAFESGYSLRE